MVHETSSLIIGHLPNQIAGSYWRHLIQLSAILIVNVVDQAIRVLQVALPRTTKTFQLPRGWTVFEFMLPGLRVDRNSGLGVQYLVEIVLVHLALLLELHSLRGVKLHR